ncbi:MAG: hypothetical protein SP1CHLAM54_08600 [Chlamydiia bacterium]|nr:hypothetical protein [Chlamydiia bacterium]MCH9615766.1 hypothetical protein [Chlamydiia bacterium]MCH9628831.1 hypothetical protein [Chlamydiia bacterium]
MVATYVQMSEYLSSHVGEGEMKEKLKDQLIWLNYQLKYYEAKPNDSLEESFNWVLDNFKHDLKKDFYGAAS